MASQFSKYLLVIGPSAVKFIWGPLAGPRLHLEIWETALCTTTGMMISVIVFSFLGEKLRNRIAEKQRKRKKYRVFTKKRRRLVRIWKKFGITGVAFFTPLILTPIGGALVASAFGVPRRKILLYMLASALFWSFTLAFALDVGQEAIINALNNFL